MRSLSLLGVAVFAACIGQPPSTDTGASAPDSDRPDVTPDARHDGGDAAVDADTGDANALTDPVASISLLVPAGTVGEDLADFVLLVDGSDNALRGVDVGQLRFVSTERDVVYPHEVEQHDPESGSVRAWVRVPTLKSATETRLRLEVAATPIVVDPAPTWEGWTGVWHMEQDSFADGDEVADSSPMSNDGTALAVDAPSSAGKIGRAITLDGVDDRIEIADAPSLRPEPAVTLTAWINTSAASLDSVIARPATSAGFDYNNSYQAYIDGNGQFEMAIAANDVVNIAEGSILPTGEWLFLVATYDGETSRLYLNGEFDAAQPIPGEIQYEDTVTYIGGDRNAGELALMFEGSIDEARILPRAAGATRIRAWFDNQSEPASFVRWDGE